MVVRGCARGARGATGLMAGALTQPRRSPRGLLVRRLAMPDDAHDAPWSGSRYGHVPQPAGQAPLPAAATAPDSPLGQQLPPWVRTWRWDRRPPQEEGEE